MHVTEAVAQWMLLVKVKVKERKRERERERGKVEKRRQQCHTNTTSKAKDRMPPSGPAELSWQICVRTASKPVAQNETVTTMPHSPPITPRQHIPLNYPGFLTTTLVSTIPFLHSLSLLLLYTEIIFSFLLYLTLWLCSHSFPIYT